MSETNTEFPIFSTVQLIDVVPNLKAAQSFLLDGFFKREILSTTQDVAIDIDVGKRRMAPFCSPLQQGKLVETRPIETKTFRPPYIKDKRIPDLTKPVMRAIGEQIGGNHTPTEKYLANIAFEMKDQLDMLQRRQEWMAAQCLVNGYLVIKGNGFQETFMNFGRSPELNIVFSGTDMWDDPNSTANPTEEIRNLIIKVLKTSGAQVTDLLFTHSAYDAFIQHLKMQQIFLNSGIRGNNDAYVALGPQAAPGAMMMGYWGTHRIWLYNDWYVDDDNVERPMIPDGLVIGISEDELRGIRAYGVIMDGAFGYPSVAYVPKMWVPDDPPQVHIMLQSAPLVFPARIDASFVAHVAKGYDNG
ncbi:major capsid protein [Commensalibacter oyaizuii]|uniref:Major capsid protein n=1 Tax=Commensalibacter oyaizuii TaxID=3043873 RepID=A0ABT6Q3E2_9PROT|nr:major capsid protein [Commensalibacter sp. TBRC 16381]MDI2091617.1 major capsid protein [Commensalibacter sp. TBRC 16381]